MRRILFPELSAPSRWQEYHIEISAGDARKVVVVQDIPMQQWAAYEENDYTKERGNTAAIIASSGTKMPSREAIDLFPLMNPTAWRR
jgi:hypothetical protein